MAGLYIHIPFCKSICCYCDYFSVVEHIRLQPLLDAVERELRLQRDFLGDEPLNTVYIGGGTPSLYPPHKIQGLIEVIKELWNFDTVEEVTVELNPDDINDNYLSELSKTDINRLSIGVQSFIDRDLQFMGRRHTAQEAMEVVRRVKSAGFDNVTIDLIYGIPGMSLREWEENIDKALSLGIQHMSGYHLSVEPNTPLYGMVERGEVVPIDERQSEEQFNLLHNKLTEAGFEHYEVSTFALPGRRSRHNGSYWKGASYLGVGPSAHSYDGVKRRAVVESVDEYLAGIGTDKIYETEILTERDKYNEYVMVSFRTAEGVNMKVLRERFGEEGVRRFLKIAHGLEKEEVIVFTGENYCIPSHKFLVSDWVITRFFI